MLAESQSPVKPHPHYIRPVSRLKNWSTIALVVCSNSFGNMCLAIGTKQLPPFDAGAMSPYFAAAGSNVWMWAGIVLLSIWMYAQLAMFSWSDLSYVVPVTASGYVLTAILGEFVLDESVSAIRWFGILLISFGVVAVSATAPRTDRGRRQEGKEDGRR
jgi:drug/metabolite transporter (DMT)-like permease